MKVLTALSACAAALSAHSALNAVLLRTPPKDPVSPEVDVAVLIPARNEEAAIDACLAAVLAQRGVTDRMTVVVCDDDSTDATAAVVRAIAARDPRCLLIEGGARPSGWLGKPHACAELAATTGADVLVFCDADVVLAPHAVASIVDLMMRTGLDLVSPYPRQLAVTLAERLVQPLLQWSWLTFLPLRLAERSPRPSLGAANGQLLAVRAETYRRAGGHTAVATDVLDDLALLRAVKQAGGTGGVVDGTALAQCRMYSGTAAVRAGYTKSLWAAFTSPGACAAVLGALSAIYLAPVIAAARGSRIGLVGYLAAVAGRIVTARRTGGRWFPDAFAHPASMVVLDLLAVDSFRGHRRGTLRWKGRTL